MPIDLLLDYESADTSQWASGGVQAIGPGAIVDVASSHPRRRAGGYACKFETKTGDERAEVFLSAAVTAGSAPEGVEQWWRSSVFFPLGFLPVSGVNAHWNIFWQWHGGGSTGQPNISFEIDNSNPLDPFIRLRAYGVGDGANESDHRLIDWAPGYWFDFLFHVKWSENPALGFVEAWANRTRDPNASWKPSSSSPTLAQFARATLYTANNVYLKEGWYRRTDWVGTQTVYRDLTARGTDFASVAEVYAPSTRRPVRRSGGAAASEREVIRILPPGDAWQTLGTGRYRGVVAEGIDASANEWGPDSLSFSLKKSGGGERPDLLPFTPIELEIGGIVVWAGRLIQRPSDGTSHTVQAQGWQYHLDDDLYDRLYVHQRLSDWRDARSYINANLGGSFRHGYAIEVAFGGITISVPPAVTVPNNSLGTVYLDAGPDSTIKRVVVEYESGGHLSLDLVLRNGTTPVGATETYVLDLAPIATAVTTVSQTFTTPLRFIRLDLRNTSGATVTGTDDSWVRIRSVQVFRDTTYESGNASILKADVVAKDARALATLLNQSNAFISAGTFSMPEYLTAGYQTPRQVLEAVNAYENYLIKIGGADLKTLVFKAKPAAPLFEVGEWSGADFADSSISGEEIFSRAIVDSTGPDGQPLVSVRTQTGTLVGKRGFVRSRTLPIRSAVNQAVADRFADLWLSEHKTAPFSGSLTVRGGGIRQVLSGRGVGPHEMLLFAGEKIRLSHRIDPDTGGFGRDGRIAGARYNHDARSVTIDIDDQRDRFEKILSRYGLLTDQLR